MCGAHRAKCQVPGCDAELTRETKVYCLQRHICKAHLEADAIYCPKRQQHMRFCMQCGKLEPLTAFDGLRRNCRAKLQRRLERRTSKEGSSRTSSSTKRSSHAPAATAGQKAAAEPQLTNTPQQEQPLELAMAWNAVSTTTDDGMFLQQQQPQQPMYVLPSLQAASAAVPAHTGCYVAPAAAPLVKAASPTSDDFESLLFHFLEEELTAAASTQFACSNSSSSSTPVLIPGAAAPGADRLAPCALGAGPHPGLLTQLTLPQHASPVGASFNGSSESSMLALAAMSPVEAAAQSHGAHCGFPPVLGAFSMTQAAAAAAATVPGPSMLAAPAAAEQWSWDLHAARLAAMQDRLSRIQMQLSAMMQASLHPLGCQVHQAGFFSSSAC